MKTEKEIRASMTSEQIQLERKLTCEAIDGAMAFGYQNTNLPPSDDHWLAPFWKIGRKQAELEERAAPSASIADTAGAKPINTATEIARLCRLILDDETGRYSYLSVLTQIFTLVSASPAIDTAGAKEVAPDNSQAVELSDKQERERFEAWVKERFPYSDTSRFEPVMLIAWQARAALSSRADGGKGEAVAWRHSKTLCLYETEAEVPLADGDEWAEPLYTAPQAECAPREAQPVIDGANFACYLIDHCEGETVSEENIQRWLGAMMRNSQYAAPTPERADADAAGAKPSEEELAHLSLAIGVMKRQNMMLSVKALKDIRTRLSLTQPSSCDVPPEGWECTREAGHEGPCAATPASSVADAAGASERDSRIATVTKDLIECLMLWNGQASAGLDVNALAGLRDELNAIAKESGND